MHTTESVFDAFVRATEYAKRLPTTVPKGVTSPWPSILRLGYEGYSEHEKTVTPITAREMLEYETTCLWMSFIKDESVRRLVWAFAAGVPAWKLAKAFRPRVSESTVRRKIIWALGFMMIKLNDGETPPGFEFNE
jgi:hypothetical protein